MPLSRPASALLNPSLPGVLKNAFGWNVLRLVVLVGQRPVAQFSAMRVGGVWVSLPHFDHGGLWVDTEALRTAGAPLPDDDEQALAIAHRQIMRCIVQFINATPLPPGHDHRHSLELDATQLLQAGAWPAGSSRLQWRSPFCESENALGGKVLSLLPLPANQEITPRFFRQPIARKIRRAMRHGLKTELGGAGLIDEFYGVYRRNIYELGSFGLPKKLFNHLVNDWEEGHCRVALVRHNGKAVGAGILLTFEGQAENAWFSTLGQYNHLYVSYLLHFALMAEAARLACHTYGMGRSTIGSGVHKYKQQWGATDKTLFMNATFAQGNQASLYPKLKNIVRLIPLPLAKAMDGCIAQKIY